MRWPFVVVAIVAACVSNQQTIERRFRDATFCPDARVHVRAVGELELDAVSRVQPTPWHEPELPDEVASDPERMRLWRARRDTAYRAWQNQRDASARRLARESRTEVFEVVGCGHAQVYSCEPGPLHYCEPVTSAIAMTERLACRDGGAVAVANGAIGCAPGEPTIDPYACEQECAANDVRCDADCASAAHVQCEARGLGAFGLCNAIAREDTQLRELAEQQAAAEAKVRDARERADRWQALVAEHQTCTTACRDTPGARGMVGCLATCATHAREQCEREVPTWCTGFRAEEKALQTQLRLTGPATSGT